MMARLFSLLTLSFLTATGIAVAQVVLEPYVFRQDFESGENTGWASYPPAQDTAYDPGLYPTTEFHPPGSQWSLMRERQQGLVGPLDIGVIRKVRMRVAEGSTIRFDYFLKDFGQARQFFVVLAVADGRQYRYSLAPWQSGQWQSVEIPLSRFASEGRMLQPGDEIQAVYLKATIPATDPDVLYRFAVDNFELTGERPADFELQQPPATFLEHWDRWVSNRHYRRGEKMEVSVAPPKAAGRLKSVQASLFDPDGNAVVENRDLRRSSKVGQWRLAGLYKFSQQDPMGIWRLEFRGKTSDGKSLQTSVSFWLAPKPGELRHPRLYFSQEDIPRYQQLARGEGRELWEKLAATAKQEREAFDPAKISRQHISNLDRRFLLPTLRGYFDILSPLMRVLGSNSFVYALTGDDEIGETLKAALLTTTELDQWTPPWFVARGQPTYYPVGRLASQVAFAYDVLYDRLTPEERRVVRQALLRRMIKPAYQEYVAANRIPFSTSNWICHVVGGALISATAIYGDDPELGDLEPYMSGTLQKMTTVVASTLGPEGSWGEGYGYQRFAFETLTPASATLERNFNIRVFDQTPLAKALYYPLYFSVGQEILDFGDTSDHLYPGGPYAWLPWRSRDPILKWFNEQAGAEDAMDFIWMDPSLPAKAPNDLPTSRYFPKVGSAIFRSGWSADDILFHFRAGPFVNHQHFDQGSFLLRAFGENLITEGGKTHYYNDPYYQTYFIQAAAHNTVLLDGNPASQRSGDLKSTVAALDSFAFITDHLTTPFYDQVSAQLERVYRGKLADFKRTVIFMKPDYFVIHDRLRSAGEPRTYNWLLHGPTYDGLQVNDTFAAIVGEKASLLVKVISPSVPEVEAREAPIPIGVALEPKPSKLQAPGYLDIHNQEPSAAEEFLVVLYPQRMAVTDGAAEDELNTLAKRVLPIRGQGFQGVEVSRGDEVDRVYFRTATAEAPVRHAGIESDGEYVTVTMTGESLTRLSLGKATFVDFGGKRLLDASSPVSAAVQFMSEGERWELNLAEQSDISIGLGRKPVRWTVDGEPGRGRFDAGTGRLSLSLPGGRHRVEIEYQR
jgi:hypothetical protein